MISPRERKREDQELICRVEGDAPAGQMMRRYWLPALLSRRGRRTRRHPGARPDGRQELSSRSAIRTASWASSTKPARTASRRSRSAATKRAGSAASTTAGSSTSAASASRCRPSRPATRSPTACARVRITVREAGGIVWAYLGPPKSSSRRSPRSIGRSSRAITSRSLKFVQNTNYLQAAEGSIDSAHTRFLHRGTVESNEEQTRNAAHPRPRAAARSGRHVVRLPLRRDPQAERQDADKLKVVKMTRYVFPTTAVTSRPIERSNPALSQIFVPIDDTHTMHYSIWQSYTGPIDEQAKRRVLPSASPGWTSTRNSGRTPSWRIGTSRTARR